MHREEIEQLLVGYLKGALFYRWFEDLGQAPEIVLGDLQLVVFALKLL